LFLLPLQKCTDSFSGELLLAARYPSKSKLIAWPGRQRKSEQLLCSHFHFGVPNDFSKQMVKPSRRGPSCSRVTLAGEEEKLVGNLLSVHITQLDRGSKPKPKKKSQHQKPTQDKPSKAGYTKNRKTKPNSIN